MLLATQEKICLSDHGIREALYGNNQRDVNQVMKNIVYMELLRRGYEATVGKVKNAEVDFCAPKSGDTLYVQVTYPLAGEKTMEREFGVQETIPDNYPKYILSVDKINRSQNGITHKNIRDFLLEQQDDENTSQDWLTKKNIAFKLIQQAAGNVLR
ncbi:MAG: ATP-binding protein [Spirochaetales bacterium]|nr:ATP-binding protein [Spirochaetales bacterium]